MQFLVATPDTDTEDGVALFCVSFITPIQPCLYFKIASYFGLPHQKYRFSLAVALQFFCEYSKSP
jgi:hypothetical protein